MVQMFSAASCEGSCSCMTNEERFWFCRQYDSLSEDRAGTRAATARDQLRPVMAEVLDSESSSAMYRSLGQMMDKLRDVSIDRDGLKKQFDVVAVS